MATKLWLSGIAAVCLPLLASSAFAQEPGKATRVLPGGTPEVFVEEVAPGGHAAQDGRIRAGDVLVLNNSRVLPARLRGVNAATGFPRQISSGDGSVTAFQRIRQKRFQIATVAEPLHLQGWMTIDELNRAFAGQPPSGFVPPPHLFNASNLGRDGGPNNTYEPENGYKDVYRTIWGK